MNAFFQTLGLACASAVLSLQMTGQVTITQPYTTAEEYVQEILLGEGVTATNITYTGSLAQLGLLENGSGVFSVESGLMLNTDDATCEGFCGDCLGGSVPDQDLLDVANSVPPLINQTFTVSSVNDVCILEFDFEAGGDSIAFNYVFGSDEYLTYVNTTYNDIFAFFLSGPGITGPYASPAGFPDGAINIAQVPESDPLLPVTISSVNNVTNSDYYINNPAQEGICTNGYTTTFTAAAAVQCGETYHIKLAIADGTDTALESFVVLESGSFSSNAVNLEADAVPFSAGGLQNLVPYEESVGLPSVFNYPNGESFPFGEWSANNETIVTVDGQETVIDAVIIEGCNDARFTVIRPEEEADLLDTLYLGLAGSAILGLDYSDTFDEVIMTPGQTESEITLGVVDDGANEGVEFVEITYEYINGCGELITTTSKVVIVDPIPMEATPSEVDCQNLDGTQVLGYDNITGYGPFRYVWDNNEWNNAWADPADWTVSFDSLFTMTDDEGALLPSHNIELIVIDQCGKAFTFEQEVLYPVMTEAEICGGNTQDFPAFNSGILVEDVRFNGVSLITNNLSDVPLIVDATETGERWKLNGIVADVVEDTWQGVLTLVDTCGYETEALVRVRDCVVPNVFTPDASGDNDNFRIRGLDGYMGSRLMIYNRYGTIVFQDETATDAEFELVWNGRYDNGNDAPEGTYQWVLIRADGMKEAGQLTLLRQD
ncbi:MAG: choice-of-anchor L domain-containing protein [Bacteroidota bacterium]|nr:choice-of-anchor L domain-containing protein [Bacteroidota bacterium]